MSYPNYPENRIIVGGYDLTNKFQVIVVDGYTLSPPEPKTYTVDIPGGNGKLDLTESLLGDTAYDNREQEFSLYVIDVTNFEKVKTNVSNFLHGRTFDYQISMDPGYTYHGRFSISEYSHATYASGILGMFKIKIDADPFKYLPDRVYRVDAVGGTTVYFESGRQRVRPTIESDGFLKIIFDNKLITLQQGSWTINDLLFTYGTNAVYFNSYNIKNLTWRNLKNNGVTWDDFKKQRLYEWYKSNGDGTYVMETWNDQKDKTWADLANKTWSDLMYMSEETKDIKEVYVKYKVGDL